MGTIKGDKLVDRAEEVVAEVILPKAEVTDKDAIWPEINLHALQDAGLGGLVVPAELGGQGQGLYTLARVCETIGSACASTAMCYGMHCVGAAVISAKATDYHKEHFIDPINKGDHITTIGLSESGSGAHFYFPQTQLSRGKNNKYVINGEKTFVTNGSHADSYVITTISPSGEGHAGEFSCLVIDAQTKGLIWGPEWRGFGMRGNSSRSVELNNARVPVNTMLGQEGDQIWYVFNVVAPYFLTAMSGTYLGIATSSVNEAKEHLLHRRHTISGKNLANQQVLQHRLGELWSEVERTRRLLYYAAQKYDGPDSNSALPALLASKAEVANCAVNVVNEVMTLMGGIAYREGATLQRNLRDARAAHVMAPTTDILRIWTGRALLGLPLLTE